MRADEVDEISRRQAFISELADLLGTGPVDFDDYNTLESIHKLEAKYFSNCSTLSDREKVWYYQHKLRNYYYNNPDGQHAEIEHVLVQALRYAQEAVEVVELERNLTGSV